MFLSALRATPAKDVRLQERNAAASHKYTGVHHTFRLHDIACLLTPLAREYRIGTCVRMSVVYCIARMRFEKAKRLYTHVYTNMQTGFSAVALKLDIIDSRSSLLCAHARLHTNGLHDVESLMSITLLMTILYLFHVYVSRCRVANTHIAYRSVAAPLLRCAHAADDTSTSTHMRATSI